MNEEILRKIMDATMEVIAKNKISGTRMKLIAQEAGMVQSNLHYYFPTKDDILNAVLDDIQEKFSENRKNAVDITGGKIDENLHAIFKEKKDTILNNKKLDYVQFDYWVQGTVNESIRRNFQRNFNVWRGDIQKILRSGKTEINDKKAEMLSYLTVSLMMGASMQYLIDEGSFDLDEYFVVAEKLIREAAFQNETDISRSGNASAD